VVTRHDPEVIRELNAACRERRYGEELWRQRTGRDLAALTAEREASLAGAPDR
jgi:hypothetical protein